jgi:primary-amine oxidase
MSTSKSLLGSATLFSALALAAAPGALSATHPLDGLDAAEIRTAMELLRKASVADDKTIVSLLQLEEPAKADVLAWRVGQPISRRAAAILRRDGRTLRVVVDLTQRKVGPATEGRGGQPIVTLPEMYKAIDATLKDERMQAGLRKRGVDFKKLFCAPRTIGNFGRPEEITRRLVRLDCFDLRANPTNVFATPIEGLFATVDLDRMAVLDVTDAGVVPIAPGAFPIGAKGQFRVRRPIEQSAPRGRNVKLAGSIVRWENWRFHLRFDPRAGVVLSQVAYGERGVDRSVLYQGFISEIFVPYQDPTVGWYYRNYMDEGEYGLGASSARLVPGSDCPRDALYLSPVLPGALGAAEALPDRICIFERAHGEPSWRHFDFVSEAIDSRPEVDLVVRFIATVGNYDYLFDWALDAKGGVAFRGGASGLDSVKGVTAQKLSDPTAAADTTYGPLVAPGRAGIWHDHFFSLRLDVDVDGPANRFMLDKLKTYAPNTGPRKSMWRVESEAATREPVRLHMSGEHAAQWRVASTGRTNALGYPTSYVLHGDMSAMPLVDPTDPPLARAGFANHQLWVTRYDPKELWAAGDFPNQSTPGQGLPEWSEQKRKLDGEDIVLWHTIGFHHLPSSEDWPIYNVSWHGVRLHPYNFFDQNPARDIPPVPARRRRPR